MKKKIYLYNLLAIFTAAAAFVIFCMAIHLSPFGDKTFLYDDMKRQYVDFYAFYRSILGGKNDLVYSFQKGIGEPVTGLFFYYLTSPLLFLLPLVGNTELPVAVTALIGIKICLVAGSANHFLQKRISGSILTVPFAVSFAFSSWIAQNMTNVMWLDVVIMLPLLSLAALEYEESGRGALRCILLTALTFYLNYYQAWIVLLFVLIWFVLHWAMDSERQWKALLRFFLCAMTGILLTAVLFLPSILLLLRSEKSGVPITEAILQEGFFHNPFTMLPSLFSCSFDYTQIMHGTPRIGVGVLVLFLSLLVLFGKTTSQKEKKERRESGILLLLLFLSYVFTPFTMLFQWMQIPSGYQYRHAYLFSFVLCTLACRFFENKKTTSFLKIACTWLFLLLLIAFCALLKRSWFGTSDAVLNVILVTILTIALQLFVRHKGGRKILPLFLLLVLFTVQAGEEAINMGQIYHFMSAAKTKQKAFLSKVEMQEQAADALRKEDDSFYRAESLTPREQNDSLMYGYRGVTTYSSGEMVANSAYLRKLGYQDNELYTAFSPDNTQSAQAILGIRYLFRKDTYTKTEASLPMGMALSYLPKDVTFQKEAKENPFLFQKEILDSLLEEERPYSTENLFTEAEQGEVTKRRENGNLHLSCRVKAGRTGKLYLYMTGLEGLTQNMELFLNGEPLGGYGNSYRKCVMPLGNFAEGETLLFEQVIYKNGKAKEVPGTWHFVTENEKVLQELCGMISKRCAAEVKPLTSSSLRVIPQRKDAVSVLLLIPFDKCWKAETDRKEQIPLRKIDDNLMLADLRGVAEGSAFTLTYQVEGLSGGLLLTLFGIVLAVALAREK